MKIGIMGAMPEEIQSLLQYMQVEKVVECAGRNYHVGTLFGCDAILVFSRWGKVAASATATFLITQFGVDQLIFTGVAGAVASQLTIGDVVVSDKLYQHDMNASPLMPKYQIPLTDRTFFYANKALVEAAKASVNQLFDTLTDKIEKNDLNTFQIINPKCVVGTIASGDQFVHTLAQVDSIMSDKPETLAVEMEGAAIAQVCVEHDIPFVVIRTISDGADHKSKVDFPKFVSKVARYYALHILKTMLEARYKI